jgi:glycerol-3-phosphate acyltransferase PlsY
MNAESILLIIGAYLLGSISPTYLVGHWFGDKDLRQYGSGTLGGSMVWEHVGRWVFLPVALFDVGKAALPTWLGLYLHQGFAVAAAAGLAAGAGHNWPVFLRFYGGRGMATIGGTLLILFPWGFVWLVALLAIGWRLGDSAPWLLVSLISMPALAHFLEGPEITAPLCGAMILLTLAKRLEANRRPLPPAGPERLKALLHRAYLDRDILAHKDWIQHKPEETPEP